MARQSSYPHLTKERAHSNTFPTPRIDDLIFVKVVSSRNGTVTPPDYGTFLNGHEKEKFPNHKLTYVSTDGNGDYLYYYATERAEQDAYNWVISGNNTLYRSYIFKREDYPASTETPAVGTADIKFAQYVFSGESVKRADQPLDGIYVEVIRQYSIETLISYVWDDTLERNIKVTKQIVPAGTVVGSQIGGKTIEVQPGDKFYDIKITSEIAWGEDDLDDEGNVIYPRQLETVLTDAQYPFPPRLNSVTVYGAWAWANSTGAAYSYSEDFFFEIDISAPLEGPYEAKVLRFLTDDPDSLRATYKTARITKEQETFGLIKAWFNASTDGNRTFALAKQQTIPPTVHGVINLPQIVNYTAGAVTQPTTNTKAGALTLLATPGWASYNASTTTIAGVTTKRSKFGLYEVQVVEIQEGGSTIYVGSPAPEPEPEPEPEP